MAPTNSGHPVIDGNRAPLGYAQVTDLSSAVPLPSIPAAAKLALIQAEAQTIRWRDDGTSPTGTVGMMITATSMLLYTGHLSTFQMIEATAGAIANISYYE